MERLTTFTRKVRIFQNSFLPYSGIIILLLLCLRQTINFSAYSTAYNKHTHQCSLMFWFEKGIVILELAVLTKNGIILTVSYSRMFSWMKFPCWLSTVLKLSKITLYHYPTCTCSIQTTKTEMLLVIITPIRRPCRLCIKRNELHTFSVFPTHFLVGSVAEKNIKLFTTATLHRLKSYLYPLHVMSWSARSGPASLEDNWSCFLWWKYTKAAFAVCLQRRQASVLSWLQYVRLLYMP